MRYRLLTALLFLAACQSDATKLQQLHLQDATAGARQLYWQHVVDSLGQRQYGGYPVDRELAVSRDSLSAARQRHELTQRALYRFLH